MVQCLFGFPVFRQVCGHIIEVSTLRLLPNTEREPECLLYSVSSLVVFPNPIYAVSKERMRKVLFHGSLKQVAPFRFL